MLTFVIEVEVEIEIKLRGKRVRSPTFPVVRSQCFEEAGETGRFCRSGGLAVVQQNKLRIHPLPFPGKFQGQRSREFNPSSP